MSQALPDGRAWPDSNASSPTSTGAVMSTAINSLRRPAGYRQTAHSIHRNSRSRTDGGLCVPAGWRRIRTPTSVTVAIMKRLVSKLWYPAGIALAVAMVAGMILAVLTVTSQWP